MVEYEAHPAAKIFPMMSAEELSGLAEDIRKNGLLEPIMLLGDLILDGRNRFAACNLLGVEPKFSNADEIASPAYYVISKNLHRRHLTTSQRAAIAAEFAPLLAEEAKERKRAGGGDKKSPSARSVEQESTQAISGNESSDLPHRKLQTREIAGKVFGVSGYTVQHAMNVRKANPDEHERVKRGEVSVEAAHRKVVDHQSEPTKRQQMIENAAKRRMVECLSQIRGLCRGISELDTSTASANCSAEEITQWGDIANDSARQLRCFARGLRNEGDK